MSHRILVTGAAGGRQGSTGRVITRLLLEPGNENTHILFLSVPASFKFPFRQPKLTNCYESGKTEISSEYVE